MVDLLASHTSLAVVQALQSGGLEITGLVSIFNYGFDQAAHAFKTAGIITESLTDYSTLIRLAIEKGTLTAIQHETLDKWRKDPANWKTVS